MKRIVLTAPRTFEIEDAPPPKPGPGEALVRVSRMGVCGSDMHLYRDGRIGDIVLGEPQVIGHECVGEVVEAGHGVRQSLIGARVAVEPAVFCGRCEWCVNGLTNVCPHHEFIGLPPRPGAMQEFIAHPEHLLERLPDAISDEAGVVLEPLAVALHAVQLVKVRPGQTALVLGCGVLGACVLQILRLTRGLRTVATDLLPDRLELAKELGAEVTIRARDGEREEAAAAILEATTGRGADVVFECAGVDDTFWNMAEAAAPAAHLAVIGIGAEDRIVLPAGPSRRKGLTLRNVRRSLNTLRPCIQLAERGLIDPGRLVTHTFAPAEARKAFDTVSDYADGVLKALIDVTRLG